METDQASDGRGGVIQSAWLQPLLGTGTTAALPLLAGIAVWRWPIPLLPVRLG